MDTNEMDFLWRLNWWYRPSQCDGFGLSVADYYDCSCDWKANMQLNECPANEADYVEAFIQNLKPDIRLRLESKGISRMRRLSDVFSDAKFEESMIFLEETIKKFKAKFEATLEAHNPFDKVPSLASVDNQEHSSDDEVVEESDEFSGPEDGDNDSSTAYDTLIDEIGDEENDELLKSEAKGNYAKEIISPIDSHKLFDELPKPALTNSTASNLIDDDGKPTDLMFPVFGKMVEQLGACKVFHELPQSAFKEMAGYKVIEGGASITGGVSVQIDTVNEPRKLFDELTEPILEASPSIDQVLGVQSESKNGVAEVLLLNPLFDYVPQVFDPGSVSLIAPDGVIDLNGVNHDFDAFPGKPDGELWVGKMLFMFDPGGSGSHHSLFLVANKVENKFGVVEEQTSWIKMGCSQMGEMVVFLFDPGISSRHLMGRSSISSSEMLSKSVFKWVDKVFDPGDGVETGALVGWRFDEMFKVCSIKSDSASTWLHTLDIMPIHISLEQPKGNGKDIMAVFDPGGIPLYYKGFSSLKPNSVMQNLYFRLIESDSARVHQCWIYQQSPLIYLAIGECKNVIYFTCYDALFLFDPGGRKNGIRNLGSDQHSKVMEEYTSVVFLEKSSLNGEMLSNLVVFIQIGKVLMVVFDPGGLWYHMRCLHFQLNGELSFSAKCLNSQAAQQLLEKMLSTVLSIVCCLGLVEYAVNTKEFEEIWFSEMPTIVFDPGSDYWHCVDLDSIDTHGMKQDGRSNIILLGNAPKLMDFILGKGHDIHRYMAAWSHKVQPFQDFKAKGSQLKHILARAMEFPVFIWDPGPFLGSIHPWGQGCLQEGREKDDMRMLADMCMYRYAKMMIW